MRTLAVAVVLASCVLLGGCADEDDPATTPTGSGPTIDAAQVEQAERSLRDYLLASDAGDCDAVKKVILVPEQVECSEVRTGAGMWSAGGNDLREVPMETEITDDSAMITVTWKSGAEDIWDLQHVEGNWLVLNADLGDDV